MSTLWVWCESELLLKPRLLCYMLYVFTFTFATWVKQCCNWRNVCQTVFYFDRFGNVFQFDESWPHKWLCNFGSRFQGVLDWNLFLPCLCQDKVFSLTSLPAPLDIHFVTMKRTATKAFTPPLQEIRHKVSNYLTLHVALNPTQFAQLQDDQPILPDPYSERFGLRSDPIKAAERAHYFMSWAPPYCDAPEQTHIEKYMICKIGSTGVGYMFLTENGILQKGVRPGRYRWHGPVHRCMKGQDHANSTEYLICFFEDEYSEIV